MISWVYSWAIRTHHVCPILRRIAIHVLFACAILPQCVAAKLHQCRTTGVYLTHDGQVLQALARHIPGTYWIDGYRMTVSKQTQICWHDAPLKFGAVLNRDDQPIPRLKEKSLCESAPTGFLKRGVWLQYIAMKQYLSMRGVFDWNTPGIKVVVVRIDVWSNESSEDQTQALPRQTRQTLCASTSLHQLRYPNENPINVVCDTKVNGYIENVFSMLLKPSTLTSDTTQTKQKIPSYYIVKPFSIKHNFDFEAIDGTLDSCVSCGAYGYENPSTRSTMREIIYAPDGAILIPDAALAHFTNEAELAALLSYSLAVKNQHLTERLFRVLRFKTGYWSSENMYSLVKFIKNINVQVIRLGIPQLYLAGYDVRYAPFAWAVEQGKSNEGPADAPNRHMPWYAVYAFNYISQYYSDVDYSKLKRGEREYAQFLDELRKADPEAFAAKK